MHVINVNDPRKAVESVLNYISIYTLLSPHPDQAREVGKNEGPDLNHFGQIPQNKNGRKM